MKQGYKVGPEHPCSLCGLPTRSATPVCNREPGCREENNRLFHAAARDPDRRRIMQPCSVCGQPTYSKLGVCTRPGKCQAASVRLSRAAKRGVDITLPFAGDGRGEQSPKHPCSLCGLPTTAKYPICTRLHPDNLKTEGSVYAVWFPYPRILKVGFTTHISYAHLMSAARERAKRRGWEICDSRCIWNYPGDVRTEAWMQVTLAFRWPAAIEGSSRLSEWFRTPGLSEAKMIKVLDEIYRMVPADETANVPASLF